MKTFEQLTKRNKCCWLGGLISGGLGLFGDAINMVVQEAENQKAREWSEKMWNKQNEYNSPTQQIKRLKQAGLNPALMYGQGVGSMQAGSVPSPTSYGKSLGKIDFRAAVSAYQDAQLKDKQLDILDKEISLKEQEMRMRDEELRGKKLENDKQQYFKDNGTWDIEVNMTSLQREIMRNTISKGIQQMELLANEELRNIDRHQWASNKEYREQELHAIQKNIDERNNYLFEYAKEVNDNARLDGVPIESLLKRAEYNSKNLSNEEKRILLETGFDSDNPPTSIYAYAKWVDAFNKRVLATYTQLKQGEQISKNEIMRLEAEMHALHKFCKDIPTLGPMIEGMAEGTLRAINDIKSWF